MIGLKQAAIAGLGIVALPGYVCRDEVRSGLLRRVLPIWLADDSTITALIPYRQACCRRSASSWITWRQSDAFDPGRVKACAQKSVQNCFSIAPALFARVRNNGFRKYDAYQTLVRGSPRPALMKLRSRPDTFLIQMHISFVSIRGKLPSALSSPAVLFADHAAPFRKALGRMLLHPLSQLRRAHQAGLHRDVSEVRGGHGLLVAISGEERLHSTAMILITTGEPRRCDRH
jgi:hypothetical protein